MSIFGWPRPKRKPLAVLIRRPVPTCDDDAQVVLSFCDGTWSSPQEVTKTQVGIMSSFCWESVILYTDGTTDKKGMKWMPVRGFPVGSHPDIVVEQ